MIWIWGFFFLLEFFLQIKDVVDGEVEFVEESFVFLEEMFLGVFGVINGGDVFIVVVEELLVLFFDQVFIWFFVEFEFEFLGELKLDVVLEVVVEVEMVLEERVCGDLDFSVEFVFVFLEQCLLGSGDQGVEVEGFFVVFFCVFDGFVLNIVV